MKKAYFTFSNEQDARDAKYILGQNPELNCNIFFWISKMKFAAAFCDDDIIRNTDFRSYCVRFLTAYFGGAEPFKVNVKAC